MSHQQSSLELGFGLIENNAEVYDPTRFIDVTDPVHKLALKIEKRPQDITEEDALFVDYLEHVIGNTGSYQLSPFSFNWNHLHRIYTVLSHFQRFTRNIPLSSCRLDEIARDPGLAQLIAKFSGSTNITSAVEGISERICNAMEKSLSNEEFIQGMKALIQAGFNGIKIYFIYTGLENEDDVKEFSQRLDIINQFKHQFKNNCSVRVSFTPLHSTLGTPTAYHGSKVAKSLKSGDRVFRSIRAACSQHNIGIRLSASLGSVDVGQMLSMTDRRAQTLIQYLGLNGVRPNKPLRVLLYVPEQELTEAEYMRTQRTERVKIGSKGDTKFYRVSNTWNFSTERLFRDINENWMYPKLTASQIERQIIDWVKEHPDGEPAQVILDHMQPNAAAKFAPPKGKMMVEYVDSPYTVANTPALPGTGERPINALLSDRSIDENEAEDIKRLYAFLTGGQTFNDVIEDKSALHVLPDAHMIITDSRHPGWQFSKYVGAMRASLASTYCLGGETDVRIRIGSPNAFMADERLVKIKRMPEIINELGEKGVYVESHDGWLRVTHAHEMGIKPTVKLVLDKGTSIEVTEDHKIDVAPKVRKSPKWVQAQHLAIGEKVLTKKGPRRLISREQTPAQMTYDITVDHPNHRFYANNISVSNCHSASLASCLSCGQCNTQLQIRSVSAPRASMETGNKYLDKALTPKKSYDTAHRVMVALQIQDGPYSAMHSAFLRHGMNRALSKGSLMEWVKPLIYDRSWNNRTPYTFRESESKSSISGQMLFELQFNYDFNSVRQEDIDRVVEHARKFTTAGWQIESVTRLGDHTTPLAKRYDTVILQYLIDTRESNITTKQLQDMADRIKKRKGKPLQVATHKAAGRDVMRIVAREIPVSNIDDIIVQRTMSPHHISMSVVTSATNAHPQSLLSALLNRATDPKDERIGQSGRVQAHTARVLGHYKRLKVKNALLTSDDDQSVTCPYSGETKLINIVTGMPFGSAEYEQTKQYPGAGQTVFLNSTPVQLEQWWPSNVERVYI